jgi:hypothetical protein
MKENKNFLDEFLKMKKENKKHFQDEFFNKTLLGLIDDAERKFPNDKKIQEKIKNLKLALIKITRKVKLDEINKNQKCQ